MAVRQTTPLYREFIQEWGWMDSKFGTNTRNLTPSSVQALNNVQLLYVLKLFFSCINKTIFSKSCITYIVNFSCRSEFCQKTNGYFLYCVFDPISPYVKESIFGYLKCSVVACQWIWQQRKGAVLLNCSAWSKSMMDRCSCAIYALFLSSNVTGMQLTWV